MKINFNYSDKLNPDSDIRGNPETFLGNSLVAFIDLLGFSEYLLSNWNKSPEKLITKLMEMKEDDRVFRANSSKTGHSWINLGKPTLTLTHKSRKAIVSDSIVLVIALPPTRSCSYEIFSCAFESLVHEICRIWQYAIKDNFTIRGGIELGEVYWDKQSIFGPAFMSAYNLESKIAKSSRIVLGSNLLNELEQFSDKMQSQEVDFSLATKLYKSKDSLISVNPDLFSENDFNGLEKMMNSCNQSEHKRKYKELLSLNKRLKDTPNLSINDLMEAKKALKRKHFILKLKKIIFK